MPITLNTSIMDRLLIGVASGELTLRDLAAFFGEIIETGILDYRKIIDIAAATPALSEDDMKTFSGLVRSIGTKGHRGAIAIVANSITGTFAERFRMLGDRHRPIKVFRSIHEARVWLANEAVSPLRHCAKINSTGAATGNEIEASWPGTKTSSIRR